MFSGSLGRGNRAKFSLGNETTTPRLLFILQINVGLVELNNEHNELKIKRASSLPISVRKSATDVTVRSVAVEKHLAPKHNELKIKRASSLPISVRKSATDVTVRSVAVEKHLAHNKSLRSSGDK